MWTLVLLAVMQAEGAEAPVVDKKADDKVRVALERCRALLSSIDTIECAASFTEIYEDPEAAAKMPVSLGAHRWYLHGAKSRYEVFAGTTTAGLPAAVESFDGTQFQFWSEKERLYSRKTQPTFEGASPSPIDPCFGWIFAPGVPHSWPNLLRESTWNDAAAATRHLGEENVDGVDCEMLEINRPKGVVFKVWLARESGYLPLKKTAHRDGKLIHTAVTSKFEKLLIKDKESFLPTETRLQITAASGTGARQQIHRLLPNSLRINQGIEADKFSLATERRRAEYENDADKLPPPRR